MVWTGPRPARNAAEANMAPRAAGRFRWTGDRRARTRPSGEVRDAEPTGLDAAMAGNSGRPLESAAPPSLAHRSTDSTSRSGNRRESVAIRAARSNSFWFQAVAAVPMDVLWVA